MPAVRLAGDLTLGFSAFALSFIGIGMLPGWWGSSGETFWYPIACTMGAAANTLFVVGHFALVVARVRRNQPRLAGWSATVGSCFALLVIAPLGLSRELNGVYIGYGFWASSLLTLALGIWRSKHSDSLWVAKKSLDVGG